MERSDNNRDDIRLKKGEEYDMLKKFIAVSTLVVTLSCNAINANVAGEEMSSDHSSISVVSVQETNEESVLFDSNIPMSVKENLVIGDSSVPLYVTFDSKQQALQSISDNIAIKAIKECYGYDDISERNWHKYYDSMYELLDAPFRPSWYNEGSEDFRMIRRFFDIYENDEKNDEINSIVSISTISDNVLENQDVLSLLPYDSYNMLAQHTANYHEWTSSTVNNWDNIEKEGGRYGRVRR